MGIGTDINAKKEKGKLEVFTLKSVSAKYLCELEIKCAIMCCIFDFFYTLKEEHCRSPPLVNSKKN